MAVQTPQPEPSAPAYEYTDRPSENFAYFYNPHRANEHLAIFIHGFRGGYVTTWGQLSNLLRDHAASDEFFRTRDYFFLGYSSFQIDSYLDIARRISTEWHRALQGEKPFVRTYQHFALFGHSLGTLGIRQLLAACSLHPEHGFTSLEKVCLFGSPINGSALARVAYGYRIRHALIPGNPQIRMLKTWSSCAYKSHPWPRARLVLGQGDMVVGDDNQDLVDWAGDGNTTETTLDHGKLVKPPEWKESVVFDMIQGAPE